MKKNEFNQRFSNRLREAMMGAGYLSLRAASGVNIQKLVEITQHSSQICRKYLSGAAIPEPIKLVMIARALDVSPGWLLFGENDTHSHNNQIVISKNLLQYLFSHIGDLYHNAHIQDDIADFLLGLVVDISQIDAPEKQLEKIIDIALSSAKHFKHG